MMSPVVGQPGETADQTRPCRSGSSRRSSPGCDWSGSDRRRARTTVGPAGRRERLRPRARPADRRFATAEPGRRRSWGRGRRRGREPISRAEARPRSSSSSRCPLPLLLDTVIVRISGTAFDPPDGPAEEVVSRGGGARRDGHRLVGRAGHRGRRPRRNRLGSHGGCGLPRGSGHRPGFRSCRRRGDHWRDGRCHFGRVGRKWLARRSRCPVGGRQRVGGPERLPQRLCVDRSFVRPRPSEAVRRPATRDPTDESRGASVHATGLG
jgi:hypothetical protein